MTSKRELINRGDKKYYVRRNKETGQFMEWDEVSRSLSQDIKHHAKKKVGPGQGDRGDQRKQTK